MPKGLAARVGGLPAGATHEVTNQPTPLTDYNAFLCDPALTEGVAAHGGSWGVEALADLGACAGSRVWQRRAADASRYGPRLETHDRFGRRQDVIEFHPAYHQLMELGIGAGAASFAWRPEHRGREGAHVIRGALFYLMNQLEPGVCCPITMTFASVPALERAPTQRGDGEYLAAMLQKLKGLAYCGEDAPVQQKPSAMVGMSMTEKQGGSDVRANTTFAIPAKAGCAGSGDAFLLTGHKWFTSAPMGDAFLTIAHTEEGPSCFLVPRWRPDGSRNTGFQVQRLKEKLGDKSNASSEVEYRDAWGLMVGMPGRGIRAIVEMVAHTRLDCVIGSAAVMRLSAQHAARHAAGRSVFGRRLLDQPLMLGVLADLALESEGALALWLRLARAFDRSASDPHENDFVRLALAVAKYYVCKRTPLVANEAMECHGGNGYIEEGPMAKLFRQSPLNAIWEGSGNVICLDVLRAVRKEPASLAALLSELDAAEDFATAAGLPVTGYARTVVAIRDQVALPAEALEWQARSLVESLAVCLQAAVLLLHGDAMVAHAFLLARLPVNGEAEGAELPSQGLGAMAAKRLQPGMAEVLVKRLLVPSSDHDGATDELAPTAEALSRL